MATLTHKLDARASLALSLFRVILGLLFLCHGTAHLFGWPKDMLVEFGQWPGFYAGVIELVTGALVALGLFTRSAAFLASGSMAFAYFTAHAPQGFFPINNQGEPAVLYCFAFFLLIFTGGGTLALDAYRARRSRVSNSA